ncbi:TIGR02677 family protein [Modestobacter sp. VKM Ac-2979]|uniref:TIGR02677 family protein n=1 Tax=unclassified Modestobacter TaxID=2643866 RepID=UPI0022AB51C3|nr:MULTISPECIES: TIGR02677 family protein [unclassified Modestobacter]MCZ2810121.1 TIGR02677 family protein [Modestobacter sp. VKM Ac-2979]MCZ2841607.1 TIGR02677 family protein [Modestobacter sp. VKM Ac-2980]
MSEADSTVPPAEPSPELASLSRLDLYRYAVADDPAVRAQYLAIMRLFTDTLLADLSAAETAEQLAARGLVLTDVDVEARCRQLEAWGNLVRSVRDSRVATVAEFLRSRSRFQVSKLGGRVHGQVDDLLAATTGVRDVARELLGMTVDTLDRIIDRLTGATPPDADMLAGDVTTVFNNHKLFNESARDFYAYLAQVLTRYDLVGEEYVGFKELLLTYVDLITADVARHAPAVSARLETLDGHLDGLLAVLDTLPTVVNTDGSPGERSPGRVRSDWEEFAAWYSGSSGRSGPQQLRSAADQALGQLLANAKRMLAATSTGVSRRSDLLRLAGWFAEADDETAHRLFAAAFGAYPSRHLVFGPDEESPRAGALTSWWDADPVEVPLSLRERGDRAARGRTSRVPDPAMDRERVLAEARAQRARDEAAAALLISTGTLHGARLTPDARNLVQELLPSALEGTDRVAGVAGQWTNTDLGIVLHVTPDAEQSTRIQADDGDLVVDGYNVEVTAVPGAADDSVDGERPATGAER